MLRSQPVLTYRWFCKLDIDHTVPDHWTFSRNRHCRFREAEAFRFVFEQALKRCVDEALIAGEGFAVDASVVKADASRQKHDDDCGGGNRATVVPATSSCSPRRPKTRDAWRNTWKRVRLESAKCPLLGRNHPDEQTEMPLKNKKIRQRPIKELASTKSRLRWRLQKRVFQQNRPLTLVTTMGHNWLFRFFP
jgi:hypothetical protein